MSDYSFKTLPYIDVTECSIANTSAVSEGETIFMQVKLNNPLKMAIESVVVNGETYSVTGASTSNKIFVEIVYNGQFPGGDTYLKIDKVNAKLDGIDFDVEPESELSDNVFINGKLEVLKIEFVNQDFEHIDWAFPSEKINVMITLNNSTGYNIDSIIESGSKSLGTVTELKKLDDDHWYYELDFVLWAEGVPFYDTSYDVIGWFTKTLESISFSNEYIKKTLTYSSTARIYRLTSDEVKYISTPDDLKNMSNKCYYELKNDIDLKGIEWQGSQFDGIFDGKGYSIKNMSFVGSVANSDAYIGLFSTGSGYICNLNIEEATFIVEASSDDGTNYSVYCGGIVGATESLYLKLDDCTVDEYSIISIKNTSGDVYAGGLVGASNRQGYTYAAIDISNCTNSGSISATASESAYAGGLIGYSVSYERISYISDSANNGLVVATSSNSTFAGGLSGYCNLVAVMNCSNNGTVSANSYNSHAGGLIGYNDNITINNCSNSGNISSNYYTGGLIGFTCNATIINCSNSGSITTTSQKYGYMCAGGLAGHTGDVTIIRSLNNGNVTSSSPNYSYAGGLIGHSDSNATVITNSYNDNCSIYSSDVAGGLIGMSSAKITITNSFNNGVIESSGLSGGLIALTENAELTIINFSNRGAITGLCAGGLISVLRSSSINISGSYNCASINAKEKLGGLIGRENGSTVITINSYSLFCENSEFNGEPCTIEQLNSREFYTETLGWSEDVWDFSELDVENGKYPKLK